MTDLNQNSEFQSDLLGYRLGLMDESERSAFVERAGGEAALASMCRRLDSILSPLASDKVDAAPADFVDRIMSAVEASNGVLPFPKGALATPPGQPIVTGGGSLFSMRELSGIAAAILMFVGVFVPGYYSARQAAQKAACANNLRAVGNGVVAYAHANENRLPFAGFVPAEAKWAATNPDFDGDAVRNSRHPYQLVKGQFVQPDAFVCPGNATDFAFQTDSPGQFDDFAHPQNISYATNLFTRPFSLDNEFVETMPIAAGMTPLVDQNRLLRPSGAAIPNSWNHGKATGQNVLRANISVQFFKTPNCGPNNDDIYRVRGVTTYDGSERPRGPEDCFLVP